MLLFDKLLDCRVQGSIKCMDKQLAMLHYYTAVMNHSKEKTSTLSVLP